MDLYDLVRGDRHEEISRLDHPEFRQFKAVACIRMGRFEDALQCVEKGSFEHAYTLYKLRRYKRALRVLRRIDTEGSRVLSSQCLYYLGYYNTAYKLLSGVKRDDDVVVNLQAMRSLAILADKNQCVFGNKFQLCKRDVLGKFEDLDRHRFSSPEGRVDFVFNQSFERLFDEDEFVRFLSEQVERPEMRGTIVEEQLKNVRREAVCMDMLSKGQAETARFNCGEIGRLSNPQHFQQNFSGEGCSGRIARGNECLWIERVYESGFGVKASEVPVLSPKMLLLRILVLWKSGKAPGRKLVSRIREMPEMAIKEYLLSIFDPEARPDRQFYIRMSSSMRK